MKRLDAAALARRIEERAVLDLGEGNIGGAATSVWQAGEEVFRGHFGTHSPDGRVPLTDGALFRLASMTKPITAAAILILCDRGLVSLSDPVCRYLPAFAEPSMLCEGGEHVPVSEPITVRHLLSHTSGIGSYAERSSVTATMTERERTEVGAHADFIARLPLSYLPGSRQEYSATAAFGVLGALTERLSGLPFAEFLRREILAPCGMTDTTFDPTPAQWARMIGMHDKRDGVGVLGKTHAGCVFYDTPTSVCAGGAGLASTLSDYLAFAEMLRCGGVAADGRRILSEEAVRAMQTPQFPYPIDGHGTVWGLGVRVVTQQDYARLPIGCFGWSGAYGGHFWIDPENEVVAVYLKNSHYDGGSEAKTGKNFEWDVTASFL